MRIALAQLDCVLGGVDKNLARAQEAVRDAAGDAADLVAFPELFLTGYTAGEIVDDITLELEDQRIASLAAAGGRDTATLIGFQERDGDLHTYNTAAYLEGGTVRHAHRKVYLATYDLWEEAKHFTGGSAMRAFDTALGRMATLICYDVWQPALVSIAVQDRAQVLLVPSNSADRQFSEAKDNQGLWRDITRFYASIFECYVVFVNRVGVEGELSFWGGSHVVDPHGRIVTEAPRDEESLLVADIDLPEVRRRRRDTPLIKESRLAVLIRELNRLAEEGGHL